MWSCFADSRTGHFTVTGGKMISPKTRRNINVTGFAVVTSESGIPDCGCGCVDARSAWVCVDLCCSPSAHLDGLQHTCAPDY